MRRWHQEMTLMRRRWRYEFEVNHRGDAHAECACIRGIGYYRKRTPNGHPRNCGCYDWDRSCRKTEQEEAIAFSLGEVRPPSKQRKGRAKWCRGVVGVPHEYRWVESRGRGRWLIEEHVCRTCGKKRVDYPSL